MRVKALVNCYQGSPPAYRVAGTVFNMPDGSAIEKFLMPCDENGESPKVWLAAPVPDEGSPKRRGRPPKVRKFMD